LTISEFLLVRFFFSLWTFWLINNQNQRKNSAPNLWTVINNNENIKKLGFKLGSGGDRAHIATIFLEKTQMQELNFLVVCLIGL
jgi:hypothetical protein